ncbi:hypothetical protein DPMN_166060 [Dreissena polymorpha]|uniref:Uncharacterized protein n=1 Tax=Dreissena polymorpha TaxID=45954 RepID=A0A9D4EYS1_DREPO|nr:hypothetical protein DPMN_166060 [Dreissena polymorpha]
MAVPEAIFIISSLPVVPPWTNSTEELHLGVSVVGESLHLSLRLAHLLGIFIHVSATGVSRPASFPFP